MIFTVQIEEEPPIAKQEAEPEREPVEEKPESVEIVNSIIEEMVMGVVDGK